ncbi:uncharacterized protein K489DRAFT_300185, partial [Dissoconium aciculare CBS 342.82]|uniref:Uncharacterized protein n=1 Tax=Dissoconium aciculare CBS 342.82 TaxID=1314786 RepID=A0A6J3LW65_9PEZI
IDDGSCRAGELNAEEFLSDFCPYSAGIVDTIAQVFSSSVADESSAPTSAILANLTKLSVYTGPSGCSAVHVDMPRGVHQFCSLIVALPVPHVGGELVVKRGDRRVKFDFSEGVAQNVIQWAAFYSDCELEFLTVTSGHHITLTYNLVWKSLIPTKLANLSPSTIDVHDMPLHQILSKSLISPSFFPDGRILAIVMSHNYAHTSKRCFLPQGLRGSDMTLFEICKALNLATYVRLTTD